MIRPNAVLKHFGTVAKVAEFFDVTPSAVYQWLEKPALPIEREYELNLRLPQAFPPSLAAQAVS